MDCINVATIKRSFIGDSYTTKVPRKAFAAISTAPILTTNMDGSPLNDLPAEVRNRIYTYTFCPVRTITLRCSIYLPREPEFKKQQRGPPETQHALTKTCRQIRRESLMMCYAHTNYRFHWSILPFKTRNEDRAYPSTRMTPNETPDDDRVGPWLSSLGPKVCASIYGIGPHLISIVHFQDLVREYQEVDEGLMIVAEFPKLFLSNSMNRQRRGGDQAAGSSEEAKAARSMGLQMRYVKFANRHNVVVVFFEEHLGVFEAICKSAGKAGGSAAERKLTWERGMEAFLASVGDALQE